MSLDEMVRGYLRAAIWTDSDESETPLDDRYGVEDAASDTVEAARRECEAFVDAAEGIGLYTFADLVLADDERLGHDFWLTRNHHGAGFWDRYMEAAQIDRDDAKRLGDRLTKLAHMFGERHAWPDGHYWTIY